MTEPSLHRTRTLKSGFKIPELDSAFDHDQQRPITDISRWIGSVLDMNNGASYRDTLTGVDQIFTPAYGSVPFFGFRQGYARYQGHGPTSPFTEIMTLDANNVSGIISVLAVHECVVGLDESRVQVTSQNVELYEGNVAHERAARADVQPLMRDVLKELGYGKPARIGADILPFEQPAGVSRLAPR